MKKQRENEDKRNFFLKKEGLVNIEDWIHKEPKPNKIAME
jgi:hypothetical protein